MVLVVLLFLLWLGTIVEIIVVGAGGTREENTGGFERLTCCTSLRKLLFISAVVEKLVITEQFHFAGAMAFNQTF